MRRREILAPTAVRLNVPLESDSARYLAFCPLVKTAFVILLVICRSVSRDIYVESRMRNKAVVQ